jgi:amidohydrolase
VTNYVRKRTKEITEWVNALRWQIHQYPELGFEEQRTAGLVETELKNLSIETTRIGPTGVLGLLRGKGRGKTIAIRADMDALPLVERTGSPHSSKIPGVMHACGHDVHTAILLGLARVTSELRTKIHGNIKFIFEPAEECNPTGGARLFIDSGALTDPEVNLILALHVWPDLPIGTIGVRNGPFMAASDRIFLTVRGKSAHGSMPQQGIDTIVCASQIVTSLQSIVSRNLHPFDAAVLSFGTIRGGNRYNIISEEVVVEGTCRTFKQEVRELINKRLVAISSDIATAFGATCEVKYVRGWPAIINSTEAVSIIREAGSETLGSDRVVEPEYPAMVADDFACFLERIPGGMFWLGCGDSVVPKAPLHSPEFLPPPEILPIGIEVLCKAVLAYLKE